MGSLMKPHNEAVTLSRCPLGSSPGSASLCGLHSSQRTRSLQPGSPTPAPEGFRAPSLCGGGGGRFHASRDITHILGEGVEGCQPVSRARPAWGALEAWLRAEMALGIGLGLPVCPSEPVIHALGGGPTNFRGAPCHGDRWAWGSCQELRPAAIVCVVSPAPRQHPPSRDQMPSVS